jgi:hypothetical protein
MHNKPLVDDSTHDKPLVNDSTIARVTKSVVDIGVPGFSCYMDRDYSAGVLHTLGGLGASMVLGPVGMWMFAANSISRSSSGRNLWEHFSKGQPAKAQRDQAS